MPGNELPRNDADIEQVNVQLNEGIESCRSVIANYKSLLKVNEEVAANDDLDPIEG